MSTKGKLEELPLTSITLDKRLQMRPKLNQQRVERYSELISEGVSLPAAIVFDDGKKKWLADGWKRYRACEKAKCEVLYCEVRNGTFRDAFLFALGANGEHGESRDAETIDAVMKAVFADDELRKDSDRKLAVVCNVSRATISRYRKKLVPAGGSGEPPEKRRGQDGKEYSVPSSEPQWVGDDEPVFTDEELAEIDEDDQRRKMGKSYLRAAEKSLGALQDNCTQAARVGAKVDLAVVASGSKSIHHVIEQGKKSL